MDSDIGVSASDSGNKRPLSALDGSSMGSKVARIVSMEDASDRAKIRDVIQQARVTSSEKDGRAEVPSGSHPHDFLLGVLLKKGVHAHVQRFDTIENFFIQPSQTEIDDYGVDIINAVRNGDLETLKQYKELGRTLQCSNQFGESILHLACRKQLIHVVDYLINEAEVTLKRHDDFGRTPLHDACWTHTPNFQLVDMIVEKCPELLYVEDKRGHTPLFYARKEHWSQWILHLSEKADILTPTHDAFRC